MIQGKQMGYWANGENICVDEYDFGELCEAECMEFGQNRVEIGSACDSRCLL